MASQDNVSYAPLGWLLLVGSFLCFVGLWILGPEIGSDINRIRLLPYMVATASAIAFIAGLVRGAWSGALGLLGALVLLFVPGIFPDESPATIRALRIRGCEANATTIDKLVGVWESQNTTIPTGADGNYADLEITLTGDGTIVSCSPELEQLKAGPGLELRAGSRALASFSKDPRIFQCPTREKKTWFKVNPIETEHHYRWVAGGHAATALDGQTRGVDCLLHDP